MSVMLEVKAGCVCVTWRHAHFLAPSVSARRGRRYLRSSLHLISVRPTFERICWDVKNMAAGKTSHTKPAVRRPTQLFPLYFNRLCLIVWDRGVYEPLLTPVFLRLLVNDLWDLKGLWVKVKLGLTVSIGVSDELWAFCCDLTSTNPLSVNSGHNQLIRHSMFLLIFL